MTEITDENFDQYFFDARTHDPERGQILACFSAVAYIVDGNEKRNLVDLLTHTNKALAATQVMRKLFLSSELDSYRIPIKIVEDLLGGMTRDQVCRREYKYTTEMFFYTQPEHVPKDNPHWQAISVLNLEGFLDKKDSNIQSKIIFPAED